MSILSVYLHSQSNYKVQGRRRSKDHGIQHSTYSLSAAHQLEIVERVPGGLLPGGGRGVRLPVADGDRLGGELDHALPQRALAHVLQVHVSHLVANNVLSRT